MNTKRASGGVGVKLREARTRRNVSLRQIADSTKISISYLEALERNDISRLPGGLFSRSFVRSYALEVGLDAEKIVEAFLDEFPHELVAAGHPTTTRLEQEQEQTDGHTSDGRRLTAVMWVALLGAPVVGGLVYVGFAQSGSPSHEPAIITRPGPSVVPSVELQTVASVPEYASILAGPFGTREHSGENPSQEAVSSVGTGESTSPQQATTRGTPSSELTVELRATAPCWVSAIVDGERAIGREFEAGEQQTIVVRTDLVLTAGDASALAVAFNGVDARPLGGAGQIVTTNVTPDNFEHLLPTQ
jgi:cytoskeletal protein RodZ